MSRAPVPIRAPLSILALLSIVALVAIPAPAAAIAGDPAAGPPAMRAAPRLPGLGPEARRAVVDPSRPPWRALVRIQTELGARCTGFLLSPAIAVTAAHCLYLPRPGNDIRPRDVHVLLEADLDRYAGHARVRSFSYPPGFDATREGATAALDRAVLLLDRPLGTASDAYRIASAMPPVGARLMVAGYGQDRILRPVADTDCRLLGVSAGLVRHDCAATRGDSGGPLLAWQDGAWRVIGVDIEANLGRVGGIAASLVPGTAGPGVPDAGSPGPGAGPGSGPGAGRIRSGSTRP